MISTQDPHLLPGFENLRMLCKAISVLDAMICPDWEFRYYSYNAQWHASEECLQMRDGEGGEMHILFRPDGCCIAGYHPDFKQPKVEEVTHGIPQIFHEFVFGEPVKSIGISFCLWSTGENWETGKIKNHKNGSAELLYIFDGQPQTYIDWAVDYFEDSLKENVSMDTVKAIYDGKTLTKKMVLSVVDNHEDWQQLKNDLDEIDYPYSF